MLLELEESLVVDSFAGGGGASCGIELALGHSPHIAINHDEAAIEMHRANHPHTYHYTEDVWHVSPRKACAGRTVKMLWSSPDCRHHSRAKGSKPVDKNIRGLAWVVVRWAREVRPNLIFLENVREIQDWGPLMPLVKRGVPQYEKDGTPKMVPNPKYKGRTWKRWLRALMLLGYQVEHRILNAADYGVPTDRRRLFLIARCDGHPIVWPEPTHARPDKDGNVPAGKLPWRTAAECIDWDDFCPSIFLTKDEAADLRIRFKISCKRPLKDKTLWRIANGLKRYVIESSKPFLVRTGHYSPTSGEGGSFRGQPLDQPLGAVCGVNDKGVVAPQLVKYYGVDRQEQGCDEPLHTVVSKSRFALTPAFLVRANHGGEHMRGQPCEAPLCTLTGKNGTGVVASYTARIGQTGGNGSYSKPADAPLGSIQSKNQDLACVANLTPFDFAVHVAKMRGSSCGVDAQQPLPTVTSGAGSERPAGAAHAMGVVAAHVTKFYGGVTGVPVTNPLPTVTAIDHSGLVAATITKFYGTSATGADILAALPTVTADGQHLGLVHAELSNHADETTMTGFWRVYAFLVKYLGPTAPLPIVHADDGVYLITDVGMRMLRPRELLNAQFSPELAKDYKLTGPIYNQVAKIGNSVPPLVVQAIVAANMERPAARVA